MKQSDFFGCAATKQSNFIVFHDESESVANKGWLFIGLLFVNQNAFSRIEESFTYHRRQENYFGELHFCKLPRSFNGEFGAKARVAKRWMIAYQDELYQDALFICLAVDRASPKFEHKRFKENYHAYNRFTAMALKSWISYLLVPFGYDKITSNVISDGKERKSRPEQNLVDNFEKYLPYRVELDNYIKQLKDNRPYPTVNMNPIKTIDSADSDLLQLTDILLGAVQAGLMGLSSRPVKRELGRIVVTWHQDLQKPPWEQRFKMHRKFSIWGFPDKDGRPFSRFPMALSTPGDQLSLI